MNSDGQSADVQSFWGSHVLWNPNEETNGRHVSPTENRIKKWKVSYLLEAGKFPQLNDNPRDISILRQVSYAQWTLFNKPLVLCILLHRSVHAKHAYNSHNKIQTLFKRRTWNEAEENILHPGIGETCGQESLDFTSFFGYLWTQGKIK